MPNSFQGIVGGNQSGLGDDGYLPKPQDPTVTAPIDTYVNAPTPTAPMPNAGVSNQLQQLYQPTQPMPWDGVYSKSIIWNGGGGYNPPPVSPSDTPPPVAGGGTGVPPVAPAPNGNPAGPMSVPSAAYPMPGSRLIPGMSAYNIGYPGGNVPDAVGGAPQAGTTGNYHPPYPSGTSDPSQYPAMAQAMTNYWAAQNYPQAQTTDPSKPYYVDQNGMIHVIPGYAKGGEQTVPAGTYITDDGVPLFRAGEQGPEKIDITPAGGKKKKKGKAAPEPTTPNTPNGQAPGWFYQQFVLPMLQGQQPGNPAQAGAPGDPGFPAMDNNATPNDGPSAMLQGQLLPNFDPSGPQNQYTNMQGDQFPKQPLAPFDPKAYGGAVQANPQGGNAALPQGSAPMQGQIRQYDEGGEIYANQNYGQNQNGWNGQGAGQNSAYFFTGNSNNGGSYTAPGWSNPMPQSSWNTTNPTYQATQLTNQFNANFNPNWSAQGAMNYWNGIQPLYNQVAHNPSAFPQAFNQSTQMALNTPMNHPYTPPPMQTMNPGSSGPQMNVAGIGVPTPSYVTPATGQPQAANSQAQTAGESLLTDPTQSGMIKPPETGSGGIKTSDPNAVGPNGRSFDQIKGTPYQSSEEREWYLNQIGQTVDPRTGAAIPMPQQATQPAQQSAPVSPQGRTVQQMAGTPYQSQEERDWYLQQIGQSPKPQAPQQQQQSSGNVQQQQGGVPPEVAQAAQAHGIPNWSPQISALMNHEGNGAVDPASGARWGILPSTAATYGVHDMSQLTPAKAADIAAQYLATNSSIFHGNQAQTFASYFIGAGNVLTAINQGGNWEQNANRIAGNYGYGGNAMTGFLNYLGVQR